MQFFAFNLIWNKCKLDEICGDFTNIDGRMIIKFGIFQWILSVSFENTERQLLIDRWDTSRRDMIRVLNSKQLVH